MKRAIKTHLVDFIAILVLIVLAIVVSGYILSHERLSLPFVSQSTYTINADFSSAKAVTPGQGQTVNVSGVQIGSISGVHLNPDGQAVVSMAIDNKYQHLIHTDATALLRPKTGLDDMFIELNPGTPNAPLAKPGFTIPVSNTNPVVDPDEVLSSLDADTREYLDLLVNGAGQGLKGKGGGELAQLLERFLPTHQSLARLNSVVAERGAALRSLIHSLQVLNTAMAVKRTQIVQLIDASAKVFHAFANANQGVSRAVRDLPGTLEQTTRTLAIVHRFADVLAPSATNLIPAVSAIPAANRATIALAKPITPVLKHEIRPFVIQARPFVRNLKPATVHLAKATPNLSKTFGELNKLFNVLGYFPGGGQHGYLWWLAWLDHNARTVFSTQDANGDFRMLFLQANCASYEQIVQNLGPLAALALNVVPILTDAKLCPSHKAASSLANDISTWTASFEPGKAPGAASPAKDNSSGSGSSSSSQSSGSAQTASPGSSVASALSSLSTVGGSAATGSSSRGARAGTASAQSSNSRHG